MKNARELNALHFYGFTCHATLVWFDAFDPFSHHNMSKTSANSQQLCQEKVVTHTCLSILNSRKELSLESLRRRKERAEGFVGGVGGILRPRKRGEKKLGDLYHSMTTCRNDQYNNIISKQTSKHETENFGTNKDKARNSY
eukprot:3831349-Rhodomonas_salina.1